MPQATDPILSSDLWPRRRFLAAIGAAAAGPAAAQFRVEISGVGATQVPIVVADFRGEDQAAMPLAAIVRADLQRSGLFRASAASNRVAGRASVQARRGVVFIGLSFGGGGSVPGCHAPRQRPYGPQAGSRMSAPLASRRVLMRPSSVVVISTSAPWTRVA